MCTIVPITTYNDNVGVIKNPPNYRWIALPKDISDSLQALSSTRSAAWDFGGLEGWNLFTGDIVPESLSAETIPPTAIELDHNNKRDTSPNILDPPE